MSELTKEYFDQVVSGLAIQKDLDKVLTLAINTSETVKDISTRLESVEATVNRHTAILEADATKQKKDGEENTVSGHRLDRIEKAIKDLAGRAGLKLDW